MTRYRAVVCYDGTSYFGFQRQSDSLDQPTIQAALETALSRISGSFVRISGAGRTDTGVHATGQVIAFDLEWRHGVEALVRAVNANLPAEIAVQQVEETNATFHPRFDALTRRYEYQVLNAKERNPLYTRLMWHVRGDLDLSKLNSAAHLIIGIHDFATFGNPTQGESTIREVQVSEWVSAPLPTLPTPTRLYRYQVEATGFLHHMVRVLVGMQIEVGLGRWSVEQFTDAFEAAERNEGRIMAPPQGLTLVRVTYPPATFDQD